MAGAVLVVSVGLVIFMVSFARLTGVEFPAALSLLNRNGILMMVIPVLGLFAIFRDGRWNGWKVVASSILLSAMVWFGWVIALVVAVTELVAGR